MHKYLYSLNILFLVCFSLGSVNLFADNQVLASVNGKNISSDMMSVLQSSRQQGPLSSLDQSQNQLLESLITTELLFNEAKKIKLDAEKQIALELELAHKTLLSQFYVRQYMDQLIFDEAALKSAYEAQAPRAMVRMAYWFFDSETAAHAFLRKAKSEPDNTLPVGEELPWDAMENYPFANLPEALSLSDGQWLSIPIKDDAGWLVWRCLEKSDIPKPSYEDAQEDIRQELATQRLHEHIASLRKKADIQQFLKAE